MTNDPFIGTTLSKRYRIDRFAREEELARVYRATRLVDGEIVDIKLLPPHQVDNRQTVARFAREMLATATLRHPNTVAMLDFGDDRLYDYLVLEHIPNAKSLQDVLESEMRLDPARVAHIAAQTASALAAAHAEGIVHRNLSAKTVMLAPGAGGWDLVKIRDFGYARLLKDEDPDVTAVGAVVGSPETMAPEYILEGRLDPRSDLYALGILMWWMLIGHPPFAGRRELVMQMQTDALPSRPSELRRDVPRWLDDLIWTLLAKRPEARPSYAKDLVRILEEGVGHSLGPPELMSEPQARRPKPAEAGSSNAGKAAVVGLALIGLSIVGVLIAAGALLFIVSQ
ncbi:MAG: serine/threonine protein kinase [Proteobacteria bacterium]|nr:serine/threonine protein kinase [Pseudomonadota bacterium]